MADAVVDADAGAHLAPRRCRDARLDMDTERAVLRAHFSLRALVPRFRRAFYDRAASRLEVVGRASYYNVETAAVEWMQAGDQKPTSVIRDPRPDAPKLQPTQRPSSWSCIAGPARSS